MARPEIVHTYSVEPQNLWFTNDGGAEWLSSHLYSFTFSKGGNLNNGSFYKCGDVDGHSTDGGFIADTEIKLVYATLTQKQTESGTITIVSNTIDIDTFTVLANSKQSINANIGVNIPALTHFAAKWNGTDKIRESIFTLYYRKVKP